MEAMEKMICVFETEIVESTTTLGIKKNTFLLLLHTHFHA